MARATLAVTLSNCIEEQGREVGMTKRFYARLIKEGRMTEKDALKHLARKIAIFELLGELARNLPFTQLTRLRSVDAEIEG